MGATVAVRWSPQQRNREIVRALGILATARQVTLADDVMLVYPGLLADCDVEDILQACKELAREPRAEFESSFPAVGTIIARAEAIRRKRTAPAVFVSCGKCEGGRLLVNGKGEPWSYERDGLDRKVTVCPCKRDWQDARRRMEEEELSRCG